MGATAAVHPSDQTLSAYGLGKIDDASAESVKKHLGSCPDCQRRVAELSSDEFLGRLQNAQVRSDKAASGWSPSGVSSTEGTGGPVVPPPPLDTLPPELVDHRDYEIVRELGRGGMGVVYLVRNKLMGRLEVLKVVGGHLIERPGVRDRFLREVQSAAKLQHKNIVAAYSAMRLGESIVLAMEYIDGEDLAKMVKSRGPLPVVHACYFVHQAAMGLQHAHERGMVHRDIKPANLIFATEGKKGVVKVLDFGLAKVTSEDETDRGLTREGQMLGTPDYIAPEQIRDAQSADIRADIYSLGCTLHYLLTGAPPFHGEHLWDLYQAHFSMEAGPLNLVRLDVPVELAAVVAKMMAKDQRRRFQTPGDVARALTPFFKPAGTQPGGANTEVSQLEQPVGPTQSSSATMPPEQPVAAGVATPGDQRERSKAVPKAVAWESLIEFKDTQPSMVAPKSKPKLLPALARLRRPPWTSWKWKMVAAALLFGLPALAVVVCVTTDKGRLKVDLGDAKSHAKVEYEPSVAGVSPQRQNADSTQNGEANSSPNPDLREAMFEIGAREFSGKYYKVFNDFVTWHDARTKCEKMGGHLAIVRTEQENEFLMSLVVGADSRMAWLGATDEVNEGQWVWVDGSKMTYAAWDTRAGQPNNHGGNEHYLLMQAFNSGLWWDYWNEDRLSWKPGFICQWDGLAEKTLRKR